MWASSAARLHLPISIFTSRIWLIFCHFFFFVCLRISHSVGIMVFIGTSLKSVIKYFKRKGKIISSIPLDADKHFCCYQIKTKFWLYIWISGSCSCFNFCNGEKKILELIMFKWFSLQLIVSCGHSALPLPPLCFTLLPGNLWSKILWYWCAALIRKWRYFKSQQMIWIPFTFRDNVVILFCI